MIRIISLFFLLFIGFNLAAQPDQQHNLALQYYNAGEYEKAVDLFEELYDKGNKDTYYRYYLNSLLQIDEYKQGEKLIKQQIKRDPDQLSYYIDLGHLYTRKGEIEDAEEQFDYVVNHVPANRIQIIQLATAFMNIREYEKAVDLFKHGGKAIDYPFYYELAHLHRDMGQQPEMIGHFLDHAAFAPEQIQSVFSIFQDNLEDEAFSDELQRQLYKRIQNNPEEHLFVEILIWTFIQQKDFESAFLQVKALDRRYNEDGGRIYNLGISALEDEQYDPAIEAFEYVVEKGLNNKYYFLARQGLLNARKEKILSGYDFTEADLIALETEYENFINEPGVNHVQVSTTLKDLAELKAFYLHQPEEAITILEELMSGPVDPNLLQEIKLDLGDYYLLIGEVWEATLLYSQVDKKMKDEPLGELARYKNAKLSYYTGDFEWAQAQLDVLKAATSELIANDALELSVFITSNMGLDTTTVPMLMFARADLLAFQNKDEEALVALDSIDKIFPMHDLSDDINFLKAEISLKQNKVEQAVEYLENIVALQANDLLADDALFLLGKLYESPLNSPEKAMEYYEQIILNHPGSIYVIDARDRYRNMRGDNLN